MRKFKPIRFEHRGHRHIISGKVHPNSPAGYLMLVRSLTAKTDEYIVKNFKNGEQLVFNTKFILDTEDKHGELHCELCGKENLRLYHWWQKSSKKKMATADHFFPKSYDKENLSYELRNMIVACYECNNDKADDFYDISQVKYPYPETIENLEQLKKEQGI